MTNDLTWHGNKTLSDPLEITNQFCEYFSNVGSNLAKQILLVDIPFNSFLTGRTSETIFIYPTDITELSNICQSFKSGKSAGSGDITMDINKKLLEFIAQPLTEIINGSLLNEIYPDLLKLAKVIPIFKTGNSANFSNYRPISLLSTQVYNRIIDFANRARFEILYPLQFGFQKNHSTVFSLTYLINKIATSIDHNEITVGIFLDLSKAFDTLDHQILFSKLEHYGIRGIALQWIKSYFYNRRQFVRFNVTRSTECFIKCGVPQGSILGPLFFLLYINDLPNATKLVECLLFADDTSIFLSQPDLSYLISPMNAELENINVWIKINKLSVNTGENTFYYRVHYSINENLTEN